MYTTKQIEIENAVKMLAYIVFYKLCCNEWIEDCEDLEDFINASCDEVGK